jgi:myosin heavy subunit
MEYEAEGIELQNWKDIENFQTIDLFEGHLGLIDALNEQCTRPSGSSEVCNVATESIQLSSSVHLLLPTNLFFQVFVFRLRNTYKSNQRFIYDKLQRRTEFGILHFAGPVSYDATDFVERNTDKLSDALLHIAASSSNALISQELGSLIKSRSVNMNLHSRNSKSSRRTSLEKFKKQLRELLSSIEDSQTRYIRCIKPCEDLKMKQKFDHQGALRQLKCAGLVAAIELSRETFPNTLPFETIEGRYTCLLTKDQAQCLKDMEPHDGAQFIMSILFAPIIEQFGESEFAMPFACGKTKVFFRSGALESLEIFRRAHFNSAAIVIQKQCRMHIVKENYRKQLGIIIQMQAKHRMRKQYMNFRRAKQTAITIQAWIKMKQNRIRYLQKTLNAKLVQRWLTVVLTRMRFVQMRVASTIIASWCRMIQERSQYRRAIVSAIKIESFLRAARVLHQYSKYKRSALVLGSWWRTIFLNRYYAQLKLSATVIATCWRGHYEQRQYHQVRKAIIVLQAKVRARYLCMKYRKERNAGLKITQSMKTFILHRNFVRCRNAAYVLARWGRSRVVRMEFCRKKKASLTLTSWIRSIRCALAYRKLQKAAKIVDKRRWLFLRTREIGESRAAIKIQAVFRMNVVLVSFLTKKKAFYVIKRYLLRQIEFQRSRRQAELRAAMKIQALCRMHQGVKKFRPQLKAARTIIRWLFRRLVYVKDQKRVESKAAKVIQAHLRTYIAVKALKKRQMIKQSIEKWKLDSQGVISSKSLESSIEYGETLNSEDSIEVQLKDGSSYFDDKVVLTDCIVVPKVMVQEAEYYKKQVEQLQRDIAQLVTETSLHNQDVEAEFEERLAEYEDEVLQLKQTIARYEEEKLTLLDELAANVENVQSLKSGLCSMQESHREYLKKVMKAVENANAEHMKAIQIVKHERDAKIHTLESEIARLKLKPGFVDTALEKMEQEIYGIARKLEKLIAPDYIAAVVDIARVTSVSSVDYIEETISSKARKLLYRLEDAAFAAASEAICNRSQENVEFRKIDESCIQTLQQQLVHAYEEIERLQNLQELIGKQARSSSELKRRPCLTD